MQIVASLALCAGAARAGGRAALSVWVALLAGAIRTSADDYCGAGRYYNTGCGACPGGCVASGAGYSIPNCCMCTAGSYCGTVDPPFCVSGPSCLTGTCPAGYFCPTGTESATANPCPAGTWSSTTGATSVAACSNQCPPGYFCSAGQSSGTTNACPPNLFSPSGAVKCHARGSWTAPSTTATNVCAPGYYCPLGAGAPLPCPAGTFNAAPEQYQLSACISCPPGRFSASAAATSSAACVSCAATKGSGAGAAVCCSAGAWAAPGSSSCTLCVAGTFGSSKNATSASDCTVCPPGTLCKHDVSRSAVRGVALSAAAVHELGFTGNTRRACNSHSTPLSLSLLLRVSEAPARDAVLGPHIRLLLASATRLPSPATLPR